MAQRFKAKRLISNSGVFNNEVIAPLFGHESGSYTGNAEFTQSGINFYFLDQNQNQPSYTPLQITTGNDVLINGNYSFGNYDIDLHPYFAVGGPYFGALGQGISDQKIFKTNTLRYIFNNVLDIPVSGLKPGNIINIYAGVPTNNQTPNRGYKIAPYIMVSGLVGNSRNQIEITSGIYNGKSLIKFRTNPTIRNEYKKIYSLESGGSKIKPHERFLEIVYDINVASGKGAVRPLEFLIPTPTVANHTTITCLFNFEADDSPCVVSGYIGGGGGELFTITGANYNFKQKERFMYKYGGGVQYVRI